MASKVQDYANHRRYFPMWHFFAAPVLLANIFVLARHLFGTGKEIKASIKNWRPDPHRV